MASGISLELRKLDLMFSWRYVAPREQKVRDRSLRGRQRVRARKAAQR